MIVPRILVPVDTNLAAPAGVQEGLPDGPTQVAPAVVRESKQAGLAVHKEFFAEAMLENSPTRPPRRVADFVVSGTVQVVIGAQMLRRFTVIFDYPHHQMILEPNEHISDLSD